MKLNADKYERNVILLCPVCGNTDMEHFEDSEIVRCIGCGKEMNEDELIQENGVSLDSHLDEIKEELTKDIGKQFGEMLKDAFKGSKNIRIK
ncbi:ECs_2282 family putative zinc-binding protein [Mangrovibacter phragmitis]|uniref:ECs_2282 family putative zinc-binding protein n=1 Tax=Mangrovibacter phragmitis TaxID=1691903 RepID=UPI003513AA2A